MFHRTLLLACLVAISAASAGMAQEMMAFPRGPIDVQSLRAEMLGNVLPGVLAEAPSRAYAETPASVEEAPRDNAELWGLALGQIPDLLYVHCPPLKDGRGLLIADVAEYGPAYEAGLRPGQILLQADDRDLYEPADLPEPSEGLEVLVLHQGEVFQASLAAPSDPNEAVSVPQDDAPAAASRAPASAAAESAEPSNGRSLASKGAVAVPAGSQAISLAYANGRYAIEAMMPVKRGYKKVRLEGTRPQIDKQLEDLPKSMREAIQSRLPQSNLQ